MNRYTYRVSWSDEDAGYIAACVELPGVSAFGETPSEALEEAATATELAIETYEEEGLPVPDPRPVQTHSGQFRLRMPRSLHMQLAHRAEEEGVSLNQIAVSYIAAGLGEAEALARLRESQQALTSTLDRLASAIAAAPLSVATVTTSTARAALPRASAASVTTTRLHRADA